MHCSLFSFSTSLYWQKIYYFYFHLPKKNERQEESKNKGFNFKYFCNQQHKTIWNLIILQSHDTQNWATASILEHKPWNIWGEKSLENDTPHFLDCILDTKEMKAIDSIHLPCLLYCIRDMLQTWLIPNSGLFWEPRSFRDSMVGMYVSCLSPDLLELGIYTSINPFCSRITVVTNYCKKAIAAAFL